MVVSYFCKLHLVFCTCWLDPTGAASPSEKYTTRPHEPFSVRQYENKLKVSEENLPSTCRKVTARYKLNHTRSF